MLKTRVIPTLLWKNFGLVKGKNFDNSRNVGSVLPAIKIYNQREVDELLLIDIGDKENHEPDYGSISEFSRECFVPLTVGGNINKIDQIQKLLNSGADKISINSYSYKKPSIITEIAENHGSQSVIASIDVKKVNGEWICFSNFGSKNENINPVKWAKELESRGCGEILLCSIDRDGTMKGYDLELIKSVVNQVNIPVIASGGAGNYQHMIDAVKIGGASAVAAASIFHFTEQTPLGVKEAFSNANIPVRV